MMKQKDTRSRLLRISLLLMLMCIFCWQVAQTQVSATQPATTQPATTQPAKSSAESKTAFLIKIQGPIDDTTWNVFDTQMKAMAKAKPDVLVIELNTPGGQVDVSLKICEAIKRLDDVHTIAWVHDQAFSAGSMISVACDEIIVSKSAKIGASAVIMMSPEGGAAEMDDTVREKMSSAVFSEFRNSAQINGYSEDMCEAMIVLGHAIYRVKRTDKPEEPMRYIYADKLPLYGLSIPPGSLYKVEENKIEGGTLAKSETGEWAIDKKILQKGKILAMTSAEAIEYGFAKETVINHSKDMLAYVGAEKFQERTLDSAEQFVIFLNSAAVRGILMVVIVLAVYSEMSAPGLGLPSIVALCALTVFLGAPFLVGLANTLEVLMVVFGIILIAVEIFVMPGAMVPGLLGVLLILGGMVLTFVPNASGTGIVPVGEYVSQGLSTGLITVFASLIVSAFGCVILTHYFDKIPVMNKTVLQGGVSHTSIMPDVIEAETHVDVGDVGEATTDLRPAGHAKIKDIDMDVMSVDGWIAKGSAVKVISVHGNVVEVEAVV